MSNLALFAVGCFVTLLVGAAVSLLVLGAILDGRDEAQSRESERLRRAADPQAQGLHVIDAA
jgi:hypothetical protein